MRMHLVKSYVYTFLINISLVSVIQNLYFRSVGLSYTHIGILLAALQCCKFVFEIPTGYIADKYGNKISLLLSMMFQILAFLLMALHPGFISFLISMITLGVSYTLATGCVDALVLDYLILNDAKQDIASFNVKSRIVMYAAYSLSAIMAGFISNIDFIVVFIVNIIVLLICMIDIFSMKESRSRNTRSEVDYSMRGIQKYIRENKWILYFPLIEGAIGLSMIPIDGFYSNYLNEVLLVPLPIVGIILAAQFLCVSFVGLLSNRVKIIIGIVRMIKFGPIIMMIMFLLFSFTDVKECIVLLYTAGLLVFCLYNPMHYAAFHENVESNYRVTLVSLSSIITSIMAAISQPLFGKLSDLKGIKSAMQILLIISVILIIFVNMIFNNSLNKKDLNPGQINDNKIEKGECENDSIK